MSKATSIKENLLLQVKKNDSINQKYKVEQIPLKYVNAYLVGSSEYILIDTGIPGTEKLLFEKLKDLNIAITDIKLIVLTHGHSDHFGNADVIRNKFDIPVLIHEADVQFVISGINAPFKTWNFFGKIMKFIERESNGPIKGFIPFQPDIILQDDISLEEYGFKGKIITTPGHTSGSISILTPNREIIVGDLLCSIFRKKKPELPPYAENITLNKLSIEKILQHKPKTIYAGHGSPYSFLDVLNMKFRK